MSITPELAAALLSTGLGMSVHGSDIWIDATASSGRAVNLIVCHSRAVAHVCRRKDGDDGYEAFRVYGEPADTIPAALARLAALEVEA